MDNWQHYRRHGRTQADPDWEKPGHTGDAVVPACHAKSSSRPTACLNPLAWH